MKTWQARAAAWLRAKADEQEATNREYPRHAEAYPSWGARVRDRRRLADELDATPQADSAAAPKAEPDTCIDDASFALAQTMGERAPQAEAQPVADRSARDADRYRWLRHGDNDEVVLCCNPFAEDDEPSMFLPRGKELDDAIDAAMGTPQQAEQGSDK